MTFIHFLADNPAIAGLVLLALLVTVVPACIAIYQRKHGNANGDRKVEPRASRFLGTQMDVAILVIGVLVLLTLASWLVQLFA